MAQTALICRLCVFESGAKPLGKETMHRKISLGVSIAVLVVSVIIAGFGSVMAYRTWTSPSVVTSQSGENADSLSEKIEEIKSLIDTYCIREYDADELSKYSMYGYVAGIGDPYAEYLDEESYKQMFDGLSGDMQGIGISVIYNTDMLGIEVVDVFPDSPAYDAGVEVGDVIMYCGDDLVSVASLGYDMALSTLRGERGTTAKFVVYRGENYTEEVAFEVERAYITEQTVRYRLYSEDPTIGIMRITGFNTATIGQFKDALEALEAEGIEKLIFDVRNNPGGELNSICEIIDMIVPEGPVIRLEYKGQDIATYYKSDKNEIDMPMAVIANGQTASAAELFTSALKDYKKATVVGTKTYGKGCMQSMIPLSFGGGVKLTTALYYPPFSDNFDGVGVTPDIEVNMEGDAAKKNLYKLADIEDTQLQAAIAAITGK